MALELKDIVGTFPTTLTPIDTISSVGRQAMDGNWVLRVEDVDVGPLAREGVLNAWGLRVKETLTASGAVSPITVSNVASDRMYSCVVAPVTLLGKTPASDPQLAPAFLVTPSSTPGGAIEPSTIQLLAQGGTTSFTLFPEAGYEIEPVTGTCGGSLSGSTFTIDAASADCTVDANFSAIPGTVSPLPPVIAAPTVRATSATVQITPGSEGSDPVSSYTTECTVDNSLFRSSAPRLVPLGFFNGDREASALGPQGGRTFIANPDLKLLGEDMVVRFDTPSSSFVDFRD